jgi:hypothetical protein
MRDDLILTMLAKFGPESSLFLRSLKILILKFITLKFCLLIFMGVRVGISRGEKYIC